jgi:tetratricopeptide (TPR) repeat protein
LRGYSEDAVQALAWALDHDVGSAIPLARAIFWPWLSAGRLEELAQWHERAHGSYADLPPHERADALAAYGETLAFTDQPEQAQIQLKEALRLHRELDDRFGEAQTLHTLGGVAFDQGRNDEAITLLEQSLEIWKTLGDRRGIARTLHLLAENHRDAGRFDEAAALLSRAVSMHRANNDLTALPHSLHSLGDLALDRRDPAGATLYYQEALALGYDPAETRGTAYCLAGLACAAALDANAREAGRLWTIAEQIERDAGFRMLPAERIRYERILSLPLTNSKDFLLGAAEGAASDPFDVAAELLHLEVAQRNFS